MSDRKFGVELEVIAPLNENGARASMESCAALLRLHGVAASYRGYTHATTEDWKIVPDGSVYNGFEVVSPVLEGPSGLEQVRTVCRTLEAVGYRADRTCGLHVQVDGRDFDLKGMQKVIRQFLIEEHNFDKIVSPERLSNGYCKSNMGVFGMRNLEHTWRVAHKKISHSAQHMARVFGDRYFKLNLQALWRHHTIEFRQHEGSVDANVVTRWIEVVTTFVDGALRTNNYALAKAVTMRVEETGTREEVTAKMLARFRRMASRPTRRRIGPDALQPQPRRPRAPRLHPSGRELQCVDTRQPISVCTCRRHTEIRQQRAAGAGMGITAEYGISNMRPAQDLGDLVRDVQREEE